jgi:hypothetical protein
MKTITCDWCKTSGINAENGLVLKLENDEREHLSDEWATSFDLCSKCHHDLKAMLSP